MGLQKRTKTLTALTKSLLQGGENELADFKRAPEGISADDLVAFANTDSGGNILAGIKEETDVVGVQQGLVIGCDVSDPTILQILNKAISCIPPVAVEIHIENLAKKPIIRIEIPPSENKPHCTPKGVYCRRDGSRIRALHPPELLKIFLDREAGTFASRFETVSNKISKGIEDLELGLTTSIETMESTLGWANSSLDDTESMLGTILAFAKKLDSETSDVSQRLREIFRQDNRSDPVWARVRQHFLEKLTKQLSDDPALLKQLKPGATFSVKLGSKETIELNKEDLDSIFPEAALAAKKIVEARKYAVGIKSPKKCSKAELDKFAELVLEGGEVAHGVRQRLKNATRLGLITYDGLIVGTAALKKPEADYGERIFKEAKSELKASTFPLELGWIYLQPVHRKKGQMRSLIKALINFGGVLGIFSTARALNGDMQSILKEFEFAQSGSIYKSKQHPDENLILSVRPPTRTN